MTRLQYNADPNQRRFTYSIFGMPSSHAIVLLLKSKVQNYWRIRRLDLSQNLAKGAGTLRLQK